MKHWDVETAIGKLKAKRLFTESHGDTLVLANGGKVPVESGTVHLLDEADLAAAKRIRAWWSHAYTAVKTVSWRVIAGLDTALQVMIASFITTGVVASWSMAFSVVGLEALTKVGLYYAHERMWSLKSVLRFFMQN